MSKIYEALQRAEQERLQGKGTAVAEPRSSKSSIPIGALEGHAVVAEENGPEGDEIRGLGMADLEGIRKLEWKPLVEKLPALGERGSSVEQFRSLRTRLFSFRDLGRLKTVMVSSGLPREGKSFIAANLAISLARHKASRVLLIDGDMRRSSLHQLLGCSNEIGLTTYLTGHAGMAEVMQRAALSRDGLPLSDGLNSLTFIAGGDEGEKAADLSGSVRFRQLIEEAGKYFDWIVVDSSPVNLVADAVNLAAACDGVLLVALAGVTRFETAQRALLELKAARVLGVVLNGMENVPQAEGYYGYDYDTERSETKAIAR